MGTSDELIDRLREIAARLREPELGAEEAEALAREAADLVAKVSSEIDAALRDARAGEPT
jgi:signal transduction histidine kinase